MTKISFKNLQQSFSMLEVGSFVEKSSSDTHLEMLAKDTDRYTFSGTGFEFNDMMGWPEGDGSIASVKIDLGSNNTTTPDIVLTDIGPVFGDFYTIMAPDDNRLSQFWRVALSADDTIDFGSRATAQDFRIRFSGDGGTTDQQTFSGYDTITGALGEFGEAAGDVFFVEGGTSLYAGDDDIRISNSLQATVYGDAYQVNGGGRLFGGDDRLQLIGSQRGYLFGDSQTSAGEFHGGNDTLFGSDGGDHLYGDASAILDGGYGRGGRDEIHGGGGGDVIYGDFLNRPNASSTRGQADKIFGDAGGDSIWGGDGNDTIDGGSGNDSLMGEAGNDVFVGDTGKDTISGGDGGDTASYAGKTQKVEVAFALSADTTVYVGGLAEDVLRTVENVIGGSAGDAISGSSQKTVDNRFEGGGGNDTLSGGSGADSLYGGSDNDSLLGGTGDDRVEGSSGNDTLKGDAGDDTLIGGSGNDKLTGGDQQDHFRFDAAFGTGNVDTITDLSHGVDIVELDDAIFPALGTSLTQEEFRNRASGHAADSNDHIIYDESDGTLWYDADSNGTGLAVKFAQLGTAANHPINLTWQDFVVV